jgi:hypothetical protein
MEALNSTNARPGAVLHGVSRVVGVEPHVGASESGEPRLRLALRNGVCEATAVVTETLANAAAITVGDTVVVFGQLVDAENGDLLLTVEALRRIEIHELLFVPGHFRPTLDAGRGGLHCTIPLGLVAYLAWLICRDLVNWPHTRKSRLSRNEAATFAVFLNSLIPADCRTAVPAVPTDADGSGGERSA